jgi:hypothetical protein
MPNDGMRFARLVKACVKTFSSVDKGAERCYLTSILPDISPPSVRLFSCAGQEEVTYRDIIEIMP